MLNKRVDFIARFFISGLFIYSIPSKILAFEESLTLIVSKGIPESIASILLTISICLLILGSFLFVFSNQQRIGSILLLIFLVPTTIIFHIYPFQDRIFLYNLSLIGALLISITRKQVSRKPIDKEFFRKLDSIFSTRNKP